MKKLIASLCLLMISSTAFAEVGPLTQATQKYFAETGECFIKYCHNSQFTQSNSKMMGGLFGKTIKTKAKYANTVYLVYEFTKGKEGEANIQYSTTNNKSEGKPVYVTWNILKNEKYYKMNAKIGTNPVTKEVDFVRADKRGIRKDLKDCTDNDLRMVGFKSLPFALALTLPDSMKTLGTIYYVANKFEYDGTTTEEINGTTYQCEQYSLKDISTDKTSPFADTESEKLIAKLFFKDGKLVKCEDRTMQFDVELMNTFNKDLITIPKGYTIYADTRFGMAGLLQKDVILEEH